MRDVFVMMAFKDRERKASGLYAGEEEVRDALVAFAHEYADRYGDIINGDDFEAVEDYFVHDVDIDWWIFDQTVPEVVQ